MRDEPDAFEAPDCLACGTCCFSTLPDYIRVFGRDHARLGDRADALTRFHGNRCFMRMSDEGHCAALAIEPAEGRFVCTIYDARPDVCRDLARGSPACRAEVWEKGERPQVALARLRGRARS